MSGWEEIQVCRKILRKFIRPGTGAGVYTALKWEDIIKGNLQSSTFKFLTTM